MHCLKNLILLEWYQISPLPLICYAIQVTLRDVDEFLSSVRSSELNFGGAYRDRTDDPLLAKQVLSQLS